MQVTSRRRVTHLTAGQAIARPETLVVEEPLEIRVGGAAVTVTMRTPGSDFELAQGFLLTEGIIGAREDVHSIRYCAGCGEDGANSYNVLDVTLAAGLGRPELDVTRNFYTTSSCGVCGKASLEAVRSVSRFSPAADPATVAAATLQAMPHQLRSAQKVFDSTGGLHAAALFRADGTMLVVREDVGRHNAVDKVIGWALEQQRLPLRATVLLVSGRPRPAARPRPSAAPGRVAAMTTETTMTRIQLGAMGEALAVDHLTRMGLRVLHRNWRCRYGELDIIACDKCAELHWMQHFGTVAGSA